MVAADTSDTIVRLTSLATAPADGTVVEDTHFTGIHALDRKALEHVPEGFACIVRSAYVHAGALSGRFGGSATAAPGSMQAIPAAYLEANLAVLRGHGEGGLRSVRGSDGFAIDGSGQPRGRGPMPGLLTVRGPVWIGPGASLAEGVTVHDTIVGAGAEVPRGHHPGALGGVGRLYRAGGRSPERDGVSRRRAAGARPRNHSLT